MEKKNNGGSAFPFNRDSSYEQLTPEEEGMSLRDYFAGQALAGALSNINLSGMDYEGRAEYCFKYADAMIIQRDK